MTAEIHHLDLSPQAAASLAASGVVAIDTEAMGLKHGRDRLCVVQLSGGDGQAHLVTLDGVGHKAPNLVTLLTDQKVLKLFHFARFDVAALYSYFGVVTAPIYCTKIASRLARTFTQHHSLRTLCRDLLSVDLDKQQQTTDWGALPLTAEQVAYAASDVLHLHALRQKLDAILAREGRSALAQACFDFLPHRALLDARGFEEDIFEH